MSFSSLYYREREYLVLGVLPEVLGSLTHPASTEIVVSRVSTALGLGAREKQPVANILLALAKSGTPGASRSSITFKRFGHVCHRWLWTNPAYSQAAAEVAYAPARISASDAVDSWTVPAAEGEMGRLKRELAEAKEVIAKKDSINRILLDKLSGTENAGHAEDD